MQPKNLNRRDLFKLGAVVAVGGSAGLTTPALARAPDYPTRPIRIVIPFATGGYNDRLARTFQPFLRQELGQPLLISNLPGAGTLLGNSHFLQQADDGYTIMCTSATPYIPASIVRHRAPYKVEDFFMLNLPSRDATLAATSRGSRLENWGQVIEQLRANPRSLSLGMQPGSADGANMVLALEAEGIDIRQVRIVTYDGGGPARTAAAGGHVDVGFVGAAGFLPLRPQIRPLLVFASDPVSGFEETETVAQYATRRGVTIPFMAGSQRGWVVHTSFTKKHPERYKFLLGALERATKNPESVRTLEAQHLGRVWHGPEESNRAYLATSEMIKRYAHLFRPA